MASARTTVVPPRYRVRVEPGIQVPMRDGTRLSARPILPDGKGLLFHGKILVRAEALRTTRAADIQPHAGQSALREVVVRGVGVVGKVILAIGMIFDKRRERMVTMPSNGWRGSPGAMEMLASGALPTAGSLR